MSVDLSVRRLYKPGEAAASSANIKTLFSAEQIRERIAGLGKEISKDYGNLERPVVIGVLKGAMLFAADLLRTIECKDPLQLEFVRLSSYGSATESSGVVQTPYLDLPNISNRNVLVIEDIIDSGRTAQFFMQYLREQFHPKTLKLAALLDKPSRRAVTIEPDYVGFTIDDLFVVGYGLDYAEQFRELPFIGEMSGL